MTDSGTRKLAAVMFTDIAGYTSMVQSDEASALEKVNTHREVLDESTQAHNGQIISFYGDGSLSTYSSAIDAVNCAIQMQGIYRKMNVPVRIGIHLGDIVYKQDSVFGDGVNVASRVQSQGVEGSILISSRMQQEIVNHSHIKTKSLGNFNLKNVKGQTEIFAITNDGLAVPRKKFKIPPVAIVGLLLLLLGYIVFDQGFLSGNSGSSSEELRSQRVAVRFQDYSNTSELSGMAAHWITNRLGEIPDAQVVNFSAEMNEPNTPIAAAGQKQRREFEQRTKAVNVIEGAIYKQGQELMLDAALINLESGATIQAFEIIRCDLDDPMKGISQLTSEILGWWASRNDNVQSIPNYEGYMHYMEARSTWKIDDARTERHLLQSIDADTTFIDPYFLLTQLYDDDGELEKRDSMIQVIRNSFRQFTERQRALLDGYEAEAEGDLTATYKHFQVELEADPYDVFVNTAGMIQAMINVNRPTEVIRLYNMIPLDSLDLDECVYCRSRPRFATMAFLALDKEDSARIAASYIPMTSDKNVIARLLPDIQANDAGAIKALVDEGVASGDIENPFQYHSQIAWLLSAAGHNSTALEFCDEAINGGASDIVKFEAQYLSGDYEACSSFIEKQWLPRYSNNVYVLSYAGRTYAHNGDQEKLGRVKEWIDKADQEDSYGYGQYTYILGVIAAIQGRTDETLNLLEKAYFEGYGFSIDDYHGDVDLVELRELPRFQRITNPDVN